MKKIKKVYHTGPNLNQEHSDILIKFVEGQITDQKKAMSELEPDVQTAKKMLEEAQTHYNEWKTKYGRIETEFKKYESLLELLVRHRNKILPNEEIRNIRTTSHTDKPPKERLNKISPVNLMKEYLLKQDKFIKVDNIWELLIKEYPQIDKYRETLKGKKKQQYKGTIFHNILRASKVTKRDRKNSEKTLFIYNERIGLYGWVDDNGIPYAKYITEFMHDDYTKKLANKIPINSGN